MYIPLVRDPLIHPLFFAHSPLHQTAAIQRCFQIDMYTVCNSSSHVGPQRPVQARPGDRQAGGSSAVHLAGEQDYRRSETTYHGPCCQFHVQGQVKTQGQPSGQMRNMQTRCKCTIMRLHSSNCVHNEVVLLFSHWPFMQFWYWTLSGVVYTKGLDYLDCEDVKIIMSFFRTWEAAEPCQRGEDVAPART